MTRQRVLVLGATGTIGRATVTALAERGHEVIAFVRPPTGGDGRPELASTVEVRVGDATDPQSLALEGFRGESFDAVVSCLASRTGTATDAWAIDHQAHMDALAAAQAAGVRQFVLLSAICVQKPKLAFQHAKLAFEKALIGSGMTYSIVRPTAYFKSLSGQIERVRAGKPFLVFGDGRLTACKPISDRDLATYIADCLGDERRHNKVLPIGGPGPAIAPMDQVSALSRLLGREVGVKRVPVAMLDVIAGVLGLLGRFSPVLADRAELARIGRYYATESMLLLDPSTGRYDADATPSTGSDRLFDYYAQVIRGEVRVERGEHAVF